MAYTNIDDPSVHFQIALYTGDGSTSLTITNDGDSDLKPDLAWIKNRDDFSNHNLYDSSRGATKMLYSNLTDAEYTNAQGLQTFNTDGFTVGNYGTVNVNNQRFVAWQWKSNGGTTASNTAGATTTTVQVNQDAGFSILTWTGNGAATTLGHGLGVEPEVIIQKARGTTSNWAVYHKDAGPAVSQASYNVVTYLNLTDATGIASNSWGTTASDINSNTFYLKYWFNYNADNIAYCFASKQGYSKFGSYVGNGNVNGPFVYTGFKPAWFMIKASSASGGDSWQMVDAKRDPSNTYSGAFRKLGANSTSYESASTAIGGDFLSNGLKVRATDSGWNTNGRTYIYMAFAENPFTTSTGVPTTAR